jgi:mannose-6-phosphate isomerase-like protein (cupin superfamily)
MSEDTSSLVRRADLAALAAAPIDARYTDKIIDRASGDARAGISLIRTPAGGGSPEGLHTHAWEQIFYVLEGRMSVEIEGEQFDLEPGAVVIFPEGVEHRNWTTVDEPTLHLAINIPRTPAADA